MKLVKKKTFYLLALALLVSLPGYCQDETDVVPEEEVVYENEYGYWNSLDIQKKWKNGLAVELEQECRLRDNFTTTDKFMTTLDVSYKPVSFLKAGVSYVRISYNHAGKKSSNYEPYWEKRNRYCAYVQGSYSLYRFNLSLKERFQSTYRIGVLETETRANPKERLRSKLALSYDVKGISLEPYAYCEWQHSLNNPAGGNGLVETRYGFGLDYEFKDGITVGLGYIYDIDKEDYIRTKVLTVGVGYSF